MVTLKHLMKQLQMLQLRIDTSQGGNEDGAFCCYLLVGIVIVLLGLSIVAYIILACIYGWKYCLPYDQAGRAPESQSDLCGTGRLRFCTGVHIQTNYREQPGLKRKCYVIYEIEDF